MQMTDLGALAAGEIHVWHGRVTGERASDDVAVLSDAERARSERLLRPGDRARFVASHAAQRRLLARYLGTDPAAIRFGRSVCCGCGSSEHGRPSIEWPSAGLSHNLSHSGEHWLLAVAVGGPVGVDIECHRDIEIDRMAEACLTESERVYLNDQPDELRKQAFFRCWTRKEAVLKACGVGLATSLASLEVHPERSGAVEVRHISGTCPGRWLAQDLPHDMTKDLAHHVARDLRHEEAHGLAQDLPQEAAQDRMRDLPQEETQDRMRDLPQEETQDRMRDLPQDKPQDRMRDLMQNPPGAMDWSAAVAQPAAQPAAVRLMTFPPS